MVSQVIGADSPIVMNTPLESAMNSSGVTG